MVKDFKFDAVTRRKLFGHEDATQEDPNRLSNYFFRREDFETVHSSLPFCIVVGRKGTGKSSLLRYSDWCNHNLGTSEKRLSIWLRPDDITEMYKEINTQTSLRESVVLWKKGIARYVASQIASALKFESEDEKGKVLQWAYETGYAAKDFITAIAERFSGKLTSPIGDLKFEGKNDSTNTNIGEHHILQRTLKDTLFLYMDDLDLGWIPNQDNAQRLKALILALGNMTSDIQNFHARIALRTDVYDYINSTEEFFDKYETSVVWCRWENADILKVLIKRIASYLEREVSDKDLNSMTQSSLVEKYFPPLIKTYFMDTNIWNGKTTHRVLMSLVRGIPRDMVKLLSSAAQKAYEDKRNIIEPQDICDILDEYSRTRLKDISREFDSELPCVCELLQNMGPSRDEKRTKKNKSYLYPTSDLLKKIKHAVEHIGIVRFTWSSAPAQPLELAHFLYKIGFITARRDYPSKIDRTYYDVSPSLLTRASGDKGYSWEIHPAYRAALYTYDSNDIAWQNTVEISDSDDEYMGEK